MVFLVFWCSFWILMFVSGSLLILLSCISVIFMTFCPMAVGLFEVLYTLVKVILVEVLCTWVVLGLFEVICTWVVMGLPEVLCTCGVMVFFFLIFLDSLSCVDVFNFVFRFLLSFDLLVICSLHPYVLFHFCPSISSSSAFFCFVWLPSLFWVSFLFQLNVFPILLLFFFRFFLSGFPHSLESSFYFEYKNIYSSCTCCLSISSSSVFFSFLWLPSLFRVSFLFPNFLSFNFFFFQLFSFLICSLFGVLFLLWIQKYIHLLLFQKKILLLLLLLRL